VTLITCRECGGTLSDTSPACPHCGAPALHAARGHGIIGKIYIVCCYLAAAMFTFSALLFLLLPLTSEPSIRDTAEPGMILVGFVPIIVLAIACARGVQRFRRWGWWLATGISALAVLSCLVVVMVPAQGSPGTDPASVRMGGLFFIIMHAPFLLYFWSRRRDFV
jgi:hypothetical protein